MIYLDNAATTLPKPCIVYDKVSDCIKKYCANPGRGSHNLSLQCELEIYECRCKLASLLNINNPLDIVFTKNATEALNIAIKGVLTKGDHVITTMLEHNSVLRPLEVLKTQGVEITILPCNTLGYITIDSLKEALKSNTKAIIINHGSNVIGTIQPIKEIGLFAKQKGIIFILDGSQTVGFSDIDVVENNIDLLAFPGHKALFGLQGTGCLYIRPSLKLSSLIQGGTGSNSNSVVQPNFLPDSMESGTLNTPGIISLLYGTKFILDSKPTTIRHHEIELMTFITEELQKLSFIKLYGELDSNIKTPVLSFNIDGFDCAEVGKLLNEKDICVRTGYHCAPLIHQILGTERKGTIRVSPSYFNTISDIEFLIKSIKELYHS